MNARISKNEPRMPLNCPFTVIIIVGNCPAHNNDISICILRQSLLANHAPIFSP